MTDKASKNYKLIRKVTLVGSLIDGLLSILKIVVGLIGQSQALVADGVHSLSDLATDVLVIWAARHAKEGPDENHPYGHERIETLATPDKLQQPGWLVLTAAGISMLAKEGLFHYTNRAAEQINSNLLRANAWHSRSDAASSLIVLLGVVGIMLGFESADALALIGVSIMIGWVGWKLGYDGIKELIDTSIDSDVLAEMLETIAAVEGVIDVHQTRTRNMASKIIMDTHITVDTKITVSEGHRIGDAVERALHQQFRDLSDITVHIDHEDDAHERPGYDLPLRSVVLADINQALATIESQSQNLRTDNFTEIKLHYLEGQIQLELWQIIPANKVSDSVLLNEEFIKAVLIDIPYISQVAFAYQLH
jgi:divalent metal cation (Fe/Co/Zn/Cd) transporter